MIIKIYTVIYIYFVLGGISFLIINRKKSKQQRKDNCLKYFTYLIIVNLIIASLLFSEWQFSILAITITSFSYFEIIKLYISNKEKLKIFIYSIIVFTILSIGFVIFSFKKQEIILFVYLLIIVSDAFSQITGQLFGKIKIFPKISKNKTLEGVIGGIVFAIISSLIFRELVNLNIGNAILYGIVIFAFALFGDLLASFCKRQFVVKDFSNLIPGHGGFLDRFDSFITACFFVNLINEML